MTATIIRIMEESAENKTFQRLVQGSVCTNRSDRCKKPVRPVCMVLWPARRRATGQTGGQDRSDRSPTEITSKSKLCTNPLNQHINCNLKIINAMMHDIMHELLCQTFKCNRKTQCHDAWASYVNLPTKTNHLLTSLALNIYRAYFA